MQLSPRGHMGSNEDRKTTSGLFGRVQEQSYVSYSIIFDKYGPAKSVGFSQVDFYFSSIPSTKAFPQSWYSFSRMTSAAVHSLVKDIRHDLHFKSTPLPPSPTATCPISATNLRWVPPHQAFSIEHYQGGSPTINDQSIWTVTISRGGIDFLLSLQSSFVILSQRFTADFFFFCGYMYKENSYYSTWMVQNDSAEQKAQVRPPFQDVCKNRC